MKKLIAAGVIAVIAGVGATLLLADDETASISPQARAMLAMLHKPARGSTATEGAPLDAKAAQQERAAMRRLLDLPTRLALESLDVSVADERIGTVAVKWLTPTGVPTDGKDSRIAVYIHGGGYVAGEPLSPLVARLAARTGMRIASVDYRLAPEHPFPAGRDDCLAVYRELLRRYGAERIVMFGDSAGGGLVISTMLAARDRGLPLPVAVALLSPWTDLTRTGDSYYANEGRDPILTWAGLAASAAAYAAGRDQRSPDLSPVYADFGSGFPPALITTGTRDLFLSNCVRLYRALKQAGVAADLEVWEGMWHVFESYTAVTPESAEAVQTIASFLQHAPAVVAPAIRSADAG